ncbi:uncharacterized protein LOC34619287 [Cyclospora cayetanensis]|uniref:Uncharacterized protein LOC34619287 n=1 Tax=Cyclospora cayetanensis TaxID=88456 RepID=A0A6P6RR93_9EIME|nr:uncharacterized protein LOC34619287 [Cyclospora cayetanensis]
MEGPQQPARAPPAQHSGALDVKVQSFLSSLWPRWLDSRTVQLQHLGGEAADQQQQNHISALTARRLLLDDVACSPVCCCCGYVHPSKHPSQHQDQDSVVEDLLLLPVGSGDSPPLAEIATLLHQQQEQLQQNSKPDTTLQLPLGMERAKVCLAIVQKQQEQEEGTWEERQPVLLLQCSLPNWEALKNPIPWRSHRAQAAHHKS